VPVVWVYQNAASTHPDQWLRSSARSGVCADINYQLASQLRPLAIKLLPAQQFTWPYCGYAIEDIQKQKQKKSVNCWYYEKYTI
jgi:hypothetical protein